MIDGRKCIVFDGYDLVGERLRFNSVVNEGVRHVALLAALRCWPVVGEPAVLPLEESRLLGKRFLLGPLAAVYDDGLAIAPEYRQYDRVTRTAKRRARDLFAVPRLKTECILHR